MEITQTQLDIARWRCHTVHKIPDDVVDDWLHHAIVLALEKDDFGDGKGLPNWLSIVAYRAFLTDKYKLSTRKTRPWPVYYSEEGKEIEFEFPGKEPTPFDHAVKKDKAATNVEFIKEYEQILSDGQYELLQLLGRIQGATPAAVSVGITKQAMYMRLNKMILKGIEFEEIQRFKEIQREAESSKNRPPT